MSAAIVTRELGKRYRSRWALRDCDLELPAGAVIALVGPNGAGKTTLLQLLVGLQQPSAGSVSLFGRPEPGGSAQALAQVGYVAQDHPIYRRFRVSELLHLGRSLNPGWDQDLAERRIEELGIPLRQRTGRLSGGQQAQVALALALAKRPKLLILDEPVASLDPLARREFLQVLMATVVDEGLTVLLSSHNVAELERVCDHLVVVADGRVQLAGDVEALLGEHRVLTGPSGGLPDGPGMIHVDRADRHAHIVARIGDAEPMPGWAARPIGLEELVLAYLRQARDPRPVPSELELSK
ncbi:ABC transporter ATP-binding protein [Jiangella anatolica]|uniref:ABC transporter ATP-binding protein n=1 Tax=Jiangella anatolica TaxID=2670374 RepID=A0A2W2B600_9ACTN|nr:ABC transporter ATP-binding protein [Jiangella anatolica]PZF81492.1 ABC transporter ATP-binding protein [Jiangella anatolica]